MLLVSSHGLSANLNIAVIDPAEAVSKTDEAKAMMAGFRKEAESELKEVRKLEDELKAIQERSQKDAAIMSPSQREKLEKEFEDKSIDLRFLSKKLQKRQQEIQQEVLRELGPKFETVMKKVIDTGKYDLIIQRQAVLHNKEALDITTEVVEQLNKLK